MILNYKVGIPALDASNLGSVIIVLIVIVVVKDFLYHETTLSGYTTITPFTTEPVFHVCSRQRDCS